MDQRKELVEEWREVPGFDCRASSWGRIQSRLGRVLKPRLKNDTKHYAVKVGNVETGKHQNQLVHHLIARAFDITCPAGFILSFREGTDKSQPRPTDIIITTRKELNTRTNQRRPGANGNTIENMVRAQEIRKMKEEGHSNADISRTLKVTMNTVRQIVSSKRWREFEDVELTIPRPTSPPWMRKHSDGVHRATVDTEGKVVIDDVRAEPAIKLDPGTTVFVSYNHMIGRFICWTDIEDDPVDPPQKAEPATKPTTAQEVSNDITYHAPMRWEPYIKDVVSGYSEGSLGNGQNKKTVVHVRLLESLTDGQLVRKEGDLLCEVIKRQRGGYGNQGFDVTRMIGGKLPAITCKKCLAAMERWKDK